MREMLSQRLLVQLQQSINLLQSLQQYRLELLEQQLVTLLLIKAKHLWIQCVFKIQITIKTIPMLFVLVSQSISGEKVIRRSVHPAGWNVFGEVSFASQVSARLQVPAAGDIVGHDSDTTFTPELASTFTNLFTTIFQRRLGTKTDGTSLKQVQRLD